MSEDKQPVQANGKGTAGTTGAEPGRPRVGSGESGGGAYANPHTGKEPEDGFMSHGGQSEIDQKPNPGEAGKK